MITLYIRYHKQGYPPLHAKTMGYFLQLKKCGKKDFCFVYFLVWLEYNKKGLIWENPSNVGLWKEPYLFIHDVLRVLTAFNYKPGKWSIAHLTFLWYLLCFTSYPNKFHGITVSQVRTVLHGVAKINVDDLLKLPKEESLLGGSSQQRI